MLNKLRHAVERMIWRQCTSRLFVLSYLRFVPQDGVQQRTAYLDFAVVVDEPLFPEFVHEETYPGTRCADHLRQRFLTEGHRDRFCVALLAEIRQQQKQAREPPFAGVEELVDQIVLDPAVSPQQIRHEERRKFRFRTE